MIFGQELLLKRYDSFRRFCSSTARAIRTLAASTIRPPWVGDEARLRLRRWLEADGIADVECPDQRIYRHAIAITEAIAEVHGPAVHDEQVNLRMRDAERLYEVLD